MSPLIERIDTFKCLVDKLGVEAVVWRFDPLNDMTTLHFGPHFNASLISFDDVLDSAKAHINSLREDKQTSLKKALENGLTNLSSKEDLYMYISSYGDIHQQKLQILHHTEFVNGIFVYIKADMRWEAFLFSVG